MFLGRVLLIVPFLVDACASSPEPAAAPPTPTPLEAELLAPATPATPARCAHVWMQSGTHAYQPSDSFVPELCVVNRCMKCGRERHECSRRLR